MAYLIDNNGNSGNCILTRTADAQLDYMNQTIVLKNIQSFRIYNSTLGTFCTYDSVYNNVSTGTLNDNETYTIEEGYMYTVTVK